MPITWSYSVLQPDTSPTPDLVSSVRPRLEDVIPKDIALDPLTGELALREEGGRKTIFLVEGVDAIVQRLSIRFVFWLGAWFLDVRQGIPYLQDILVANPDMILIEAIFRRVILTTPGIAELSRFTMTKNDTTRELRVEDFRARLVDGSTLIARSNPFLIAAQPASEV